MFDLVFGWVRMLVKQLSRHHDEPGCTVAALKGAGFDESLLHGTEPIARLQAFDRGHLRTIEKRRKIEAARNSAPVHEDCATAAEALAAALSRASETEMSLQGLH
jgi:hypothetical protein